MYANYSIIPRNMIYFLIHQMYIFSSFSKKSDRVYITIDKTKLPFTSTYNMYQVKTILSEYQQPLKAALVLLFSRFCIKSIVIECMFINNVVK